MAVAAHIGSGHLQVDPVIGLLLRVDVNVAIDAADFLQVLCCSELANRAKVIFHVL
jgi:hypothetical protein